MVLSRTLLKSEHNAFIMELPLYHLPNARTIGLLVWQRTLGFVKHAGTLILVMALAVWALSVIPTGNVETSILGQIGKVAVAVGNLMGLSWQLVVALLASFVAKENSIATLGILFGTGDNSASAGGDAGHGHYAGGGVEFSGGAAVVHSVRGDHRRDQAGDALVEVDVVHDRHVGGDLVWGWVGGVSNHVVASCEGAAMFDKLMTRLKRGGTVTVDQMARELDTSPEVVGQMIDHLTRARAAAADEGELRSGVQSVSWCAIAEALSAVECGWQMISACRLDD